MPDAAVVPPSPTPSPIFDAVEAEEPTPAPVAKAPPAAPARPAHTPRQVRLAEDLGMSAAEIASYTPAELDTAVYHQQMAVNRMARELMRQDAHRAALQQQPAPTPGPAVPITYPEDELVFAADEIHPDLVKLAELTKSQARKVRELEGKLAKSEEGLQQREQLSRFEMIDAAFAALPTEYLALVGDQDSPEIDKASHEWRRRIAVLQTCGLDINKPFTARQIHKAILTTATSLFSTRAAPAAAPDSVGAYGAAAVPAPASPPARAPARNPANGRYTAEEWERAATPVPTDRKGAEEPAGVEKAKKSIAAALRDRGAYVDNGRAGDVTLEDFPG